MSHSEEKFFFNVHNFDDEVMDDDLLDEEEEEDLPPPPPLFTESELAAAKKEAYKEGHMKAAQEALESREQDVSNLLQRITNDFQSLLAAEKDRDSLYEREAITLCRAIFEQAFPNIQDKLGGEALMAQMHNILQAQQGQKHIEIRIAPDYAQDVDALIERIRMQNSDIVLKVIADEALETGRFKLNWSHGGALYDQNALAKEILGNLDEMLAGGGTTSHYKRSEESKLCALDTSAQDLQDDKSNNDLAENIPAEGSTVEDNDE